MQYTKDAMVLTLVILCFWTRAVDAVKCYLCTTHFAIKGPPDSLSSFVLQDYKKEDNIQGQCVIRPQDSNITECADGCLTITGKGHLLVGGNTTANGGANQAAGVSGWHQAKGSTGVGRRCAEHLLKLSEGLTVPKPETCEFQEGNLLGVRAHLMICRCNTDLCNTRTDLFEQLAKEFCIVYHIPPDEVVGNLKKDIFDERDTKDRQSCIFECARKPGCASVRIEQKMNGSGVKCAMSSYSIPCDGVNPTELSDDIEPANVGAYWLSCLSNGCKKSTAKTTAEDIPIPTNCRLRAVDKFPAYCNRLQNERGDRRFCRYAGFKNTCPRTCCDY